VFGEFRAIVGQDEFHGKGKYLEAEFEEFRGGERCVGFCAPGESKPGVDVFKGDNVSPVAVQMLFNGVQSHQVPRIENLEILGLSDLFLSFQRLYFAEMRYFLRKHAESSQVFDNSADSGYFGAFKVVHSAEFQKFGIKLVFSEIGMRETLAFDFRNDLLRPGADSFLLGSAGAVIQGFQLSAGGFPNRFPMIESPFLYRKSVENGLSSVFFPKHQNAGFLECLFTNHILVFEVMIIRSNETPNTRIFAMYFMKKRHALTFSWSAIC